MIKILFLIHDLGQGGAEKVLINLVNNMDRTKFEITVMSLFGGGVNEQFLKKDITYKTVYKKVFPGNSKLMKLFSPEQLHKKYIKDEYDIEVSYLEGPSARIISGCQNPKTKLVSWIHCTMQSENDVAESFRNYKEAVACYNRMDEMVFVANTVRDHFLKKCDYKGNVNVIYNTVESDVIKQKASEEVDIDIISPSLVAAGTLKPVKGFDRLLRIVKVLREYGQDVHLYLLGDGPERNSLEELSKTFNLTEYVSFLGHQTNPYKYMAKCDIFVCSSHSEGFSTAATEALIVGTPVCTVEVSGMKEMLGENNEYGVITENSEEALCQGIKQVMEDGLLVHYKEMANQRGKIFDKENTVKIVENMLMSL